MRNSVSTWALTAIILATGCSDGPAGEATDALKVLVAAQSADGCVPSTNGSATFPDGVNRIELRLSNGFSDRLLVEDLDEKGQILVQGVTPGQDLQLDLYGCTEANVTWSGRATAVTVEPSEKTAPRLFFTRKNAFSCTGSDDAGRRGWRAEMFEQVPDSTSIIGRVLHTAVPVVGGKVLLIGGFNAYVPVTPDILRVGVDTVESITEYDPTRGVFRTWDAQLKAKRGAHHSVAFDGGKKVLVFGGLTRAALQAPSFPPLSPLPEDGAENADPAVAVELIDVEARTVTTSALALQTLPMGAVAASSNGLSIVVSGGRLDNEEPSDAVTVLTGTVEEMALGTAKPVAAKLEVPRMGHTSTFFGPGHVLMLGGNFGTEPFTDDPDPSNLAEVLPADNNAPVKVTLEDSDPIVPMGLHETLLLRSEDCRHVFLVAGGMGLQREDENQKPIFISPSKQVARFALLEIDACDTTNIKGRFADQSAQFDDATRPRRIFHSLTNLGDGLVMMAGGYHARFEPEELSDLCETETLSVGCYLSDVVLIDASGNTAVVDKENSFAFSRARFGHRVTVLPDGTALATGGLRELNGNGTTSVVPDTEIFNPLRASERDVCAD